MAQFTREKRSERSAPPVERSVSITGMTGYQEVFTDPSYYGQVIIMNSVHIGNYGIKDDEVESDSVKIRGLIARNLEEQYSRKMAQWLPERLSQGK